MARLQPDPSAPLDGAETRLRPAIRRFLAAKAKANDTGNYSRNAGLALERFASWADGRGYRELGDLDVDALASYASRLKQRVDAGRTTTASDTTGISADSARTYFRYISAWLTWCVKRGLIDANPADRSVVTDALPDGTGQGAQQYWDAQARAALLRWAEWVVEDTADTEWMPHDRAVRNAALVALVAYSGARIGELLRAPGDRDARRTGLRWRDVDLEGRRLEVLGKSQDYEQAPIPKRAFRHVLAHYRRQDPPTEDWPVFPTGHAPSKYDAARRGLRDRGHDDDGIERILDALQAGEIDALLREREIPPPSLTTEGGRTIITDLATAAGIRVDGELPKPHGGRRGIGRTTYAEIGPGKSQKLLRHQNPEVTSEMYADLEVDEIREDVDEAVSNRGG